MCISCPSLCPWKTTTSTRSESLKSQRSLSEKSTSAHARISHTPSDDDTILNQLSGLSTLIKTHAENFYQTFPNTSGHAPSLEETQALRDGVRINITRRALATDEFQVSDRGFAAIIPTELIKSGLADRRSRSLHELFDRANSILRDMRSQSNLWNFGEWQNSMLEEHITIVFPSVLKGSQIVRKPEYSQRNQFFDRYDFREIPGTKKSFSFPGRKTKVILQDKMKINRKSLA
ncbi:hypothetical protein EDC01DRAFT_730110 [Geopyxis carbonaria]|nr:hypothetical protein EDC01DRAFT_730110 [Geopyxis carbonaria]